MAYHNVVFCICLPPHCAEAKAALPATMLRHDMAITWHRLPQRGVLHMPVTPYFVEAEAALLAIMLRHDMATTWHGHKRRHILHLPNAA